LSKDLFTTYNIDPYLSHSFIFISHRHNLNQSTTTQCNK